MRKTEFETIMLEQARAHRRERANPLACPQMTLSAPVVIEGVGLHTGRMIRMDMHPAAAGFGIVFRRVDLDSTDRAVTDLPARFDHVGDTTLSTVVRNETGTSVGTVEHLMAALSFLGLDNLLIEIDGPEIPVMDGSSQIFIETIEAVGLKALAAPRRAIRILKPVVVEDGLKRAALLPGDGFKLAFEIEFDNPVIGHETIEADFNDPSFKDDILRARTFGFLKDVEAMWKVGLGLGGSLENTVVIDGDQVLNEEGLRFADEFVRHKVLDAVGDLALAGAPLIGRYEGLRAGHAMNNRVLRALFADASAYEIVDLASGTAPEARRIQAVPAE
ncbi:UDP-3-O-acyl-N-acetylglucosamine deacetylase [Parvibaculum sp.]|uniref:UDP-3-O-acyl-N-acetylglucosamine deacetylase n=1 Tax=Parvibaculum sp. TaxID=2024848 RepID=UPI002CD0F90C|nr:UDP-3-O-acyl-N-acetylglucosamine deacetylase [Parvibaculum sp.]HUD51924.1 UDP-3-O-acyl-N-acetylglucosamine deacetylase [Parvibaculum sp.]